MRFGSWSNRWQLDTPGSFFVTYRKEDSVENKRLAEVGDFVFRNGVTCSGEPLLS